LPSELPCSFRTSRPAAVDPGVDDGVGVLMPVAFTRGCDVFGCGRAKPCPIHGRRRTQASRQARGYDAWWLRVSAAHLRRYPLCGDRPPEAPATTDSVCLAEGRAVQATTTDHIRPHRGDDVLRRAVWNRQSLCQRCHGIKSARERQAR
jgi:5-methylcytosine-specific restriction endonuclease McrA